MTTKRTRHEIAIDAPPKHVFELLADVSRWSGIFPPTVHSRRIEGNDTEETIEIWATAADEFRHWTSSRSIDEHAMTIEFRQTKPAMPLESMLGRWVIKPDGDSAHVELFHEYSVRVGHDESSGWVDDVVNANSTKELHSLRSATIDRRLALTFHDTLEVEAPPNLIFEFLNRSDLWPARLPHVSTLELEQLTGDQQVMTMTTTTPNGDEHVTRSHRVCLAEDGVIAYKQSRPPELLTTHAGLWIIEPGSGTRSTRLTAEHRITINPDSVMRLLGTGATVDDAKIRAQTALTYNSRTTMLTAAAWAENAHRENV